MPNRPKPEGPIFIDMAHSLFDQLTMSQVIHVANLALNRLTMRDIGEIMGEVGVRPNLVLTTEADNDRQA